MEVLMQNHPKWSIFHCHVWLPTAVENEHVGQTDFQSQSRTQRVGRRNIRSNSSLICSNPVWHRRPAMLDKNDLGSNERSHSCLLSRFVRKQGILFYSMRCFPPSKSSIWADTLILQFKQKKQGPHRLRTFFRIASRVARLAWPSYGLSGLWQVTCDLIHVNWRCYQATNKNQHTQDTTSSSSTFVSPLNMQMSNCSASSEKPRAKISAPDRLWLLAFHGFTSIFWSVARTYCAIQLSYPQKTTYIYIYMHMYK